MLIKPTKLVCFWILFLQNTKAQLLNKIDYKQWAIIVIFLYLQIKFYLFFSVKKSWDSIRTVTKAKYSHICLVSSFVQADLFDILLPMLNIYQEFVRNHQYSLQVLANCKQNRDFDKLLKQYESNAACEGRMLETFLTYPMFQVNLTAVESYEITFQLTIFFNDVLFPPKRFLVTSSPCTNY